MKKSLKIFYYYLMNKKLLMNSLKFNHYLCPKTKKTKIINKECLNNLEFLVYVEIYIMFHYF